MIVVAEGLCSIIEEACNHRWIEAVCRLLYYFREGVYKLQEGLLVVERK